MNNAHRYVYTAILALQKAQGDVAPYFGQCPPRVFADLIQDPDLEPCYWIGSINTPVTFNKQLYHCVRVAGVLIYPCSRIPEINPDGSNSILLFFSRHA